MGRPKGSKNKKSKTATEPVQAVENIVESPEPQISDQTNEVSMKEKNRALELGLEDPDFDFREIYERGNMIFYVYVNEFDGTKEVQELTVRTVYARSMVAYEDHGMCHCIGYNDKDRVFMDRHQAEKLCKQIKVVAKYGGDGT